MGPTKLITLYILCCGCVATTATATASLPSTSLSAATTSSSSSDALREAGAPPSSEANVDSTSSISLRDDDLQQQGRRDHAELVKKQLGDRLDRVLSGQRQRDVAKWIQRQRQQHCDGPAPPQEIGTEAAQATSAGTEPRRKRKPSNDPFPVDRMCLDLVLDDRQAGNDGNRREGGVGFDAATTNSSLSVSVTPTNSTSSLVATSMSSLTTRLSSMASKVIAQATWTAQLGLRTVQLGWNFGPVTTTVGFAYLSSQFRNTYWYPWLANSMGRSGPAFIKWGQWSSTRPDLFPEAFCDALSTLHSNAPAHDWKHSESTLEDALRLPRTATPSSLLSTVFDELDPIPLASGSIAQVHKAVLDGRLVAVKIRHPNVEHLMEMDFTIMNWAATALDRTLPILRWLHIRETLDQFSTSLKAQADLRVEAIHLERLNHNFRKWPHVRFPHPIFATAAVIVETFEPGRIVTTVLDMYEDLANTINREESLAHRASVDTHLLRLTTASKKEGGSSTPSFALVASGGSGKPDRVDRQPAVASTPSHDPGDTTGSQIEGHHLIPITMAKFIVTTGLSVYLKMLLVDNLMHADLYVLLGGACELWAMCRESLLCSIYPLPRDLTSLSSLARVHAKRYFRHPGNIMVHFHRHYHRRLSLHRKKTRRRNDQESMLSMVPSGDAQSTTAQKKRLDRLLGICLVDAGMVAQLSNHESSTFIGLLSSLGEGDGASAADFALGFSLENHMSDDDRAEFRTDMVALFEERCRGYGSNVDVGHVLRGILGLIRKHQVRIDANYATLVVNCLCIESLARAVCPSYNVLDAARPLLQSYRRLFYGRDGSPHAIEVKRRRKRWWVQAWLSLMYVRKSRQDRQFFRREERRNKARTRAQRLLLEISS